MRSTSEPTAYKQHLQQRIVTTATKLFRQKGVKAVKMDDIANKLSISKRTLYEIFHDKEDLLLECVKASRNDFQHHMTHFKGAKSASSIDLVVEFYRFQMETLSNLSPLYFNDIEKYPKVMQWLAANRQERSQEAVAFFTNGIEAGYFRSDVDYHLIFRVCDTTVNRIMRDRLYLEYSMKQIFHDVIMLYVRGFCTLKGIEALEKAIQ